MRRFRRVRVGGAAWVRWVILLLAVGYLMLRVADAMMVEPLTAVAEQEARLRAIDAINRVVGADVAKAMRSDSMVSYEKNQQGDIVAAHINTPLVNTVASEVAANMAKEFRDLSTGTFGVPIGALSRSQFLATQGPVIPVRMLPIGTVTIDIQQKFESAGINQTRHSIILHATARVRVVLPVMTKEMEVTSDYPVSETVFLGQVPQYYGGKIDSISVPANK